VTALASAAVEEARNKVGKESKDSLELAVPLAAATLGSFLTQYGAAMKNLSNTDNKRPSIVPMEEMEG
jgi:hypothetical protein